MHNDLSDARDFPQGSLNDESMQKDNIFNIHNPEEYIFHILSSSVSTSDFPQGNLSDESMQNNSNSVTQDSMNVNINVPSCNSDIHQKKSVSMVAEDEGNSESTQFITPKTGFNELKKIETEEGDVGENFGDISGENNEIDVKDPVRQNDDDEKENSNTKNSTETQNVNDVKKKYPFFIVYKNETRKYHDDDIRKRCKTGFTHNLVEFINNRAIMLRSDIKFKKPYYSYYNEKNIKIKKGEETNKSYLGVKNKAIIEKTDKKGEKVGPLNTILEMHSTYFLLVWSHSKTEEEIIKALKYIAASLQNESKTPQDKIDEQMAELYFFCLYFGIPYFMEKFEKDEKPKYIGREEKLKFYLKRVEIVAEELFYFLTSEDKKKPKKKKVFTTSKSSE